MESKFKGEKVRLRNKIIIVVNGKGGVGKDSVCDALANFFTAKHISSITPVKELASLCGWSGEKTPEARKFLSDLKALLIGYNNLPLNYLMSEVKRFISDDNTDILFVDIRESDEIRKFIMNVEVEHSILIKTLIVRSQRPELVGKYGNHSDDHVENYIYDYTFENDGDLDLLEEKVWHTFITIFQQEGLTGSHMPS